ncbi:MAG: NAD(P)-dependent oxidoreductase [Succinivibrio sp.]|nr:NAD(P)-dependent oxidoreductase [Succinivibrio sp.]
MIRAVITGGSGFIGQALTIHLLSLGWAVTAVVRKAEKLAHLKRQELEVVEADLSHYNSLSNPIAHKADYFFHLAWDGLTPETYSEQGRQLENVSASLQALEAANALSCRKFIFLGSAYELQVPCDTSNGALPSARAPYAIAKLCAAQMCLHRSQQLDLQFNHVLPTGVFGPGDRSHRAPNTVISAFLSGKAPAQLISADTPQDWLYIKDLLRMLTAVAQQGRPYRSYYLGHTVPTTFGNIITTIRDLLLPEAPLQFGTMPDPTAATLREISHTALLEDTGVKADYPFDQAILETASYLRSHPLELSA